MRRLAVAAAGLTLLTACQSSTGATTASSGSTTSGGAGTSGAASNDSIYAPIRSYIGGSGSGKADPSASPITIGFVNTTGGTSAVPSWSVTAKAAVAVVNDKLGGIDGHPVKLLTCDSSGSEGEGQLCAEKMLADNTVKAVDEGWLLTGGASFHNTIAGKLPVFGGLGQGPDTVATNSYYLSSGPLSTSTASKYFVQKVAKSSQVSLLYPNIPEVARDVAEAGQLLKPQGITQSNYAYPLGSTDLTASVASANINAKGAGQLIVIGASACAPLDNALTSAGVTKPVATLGFCSSQSVKKSLGDFPKWSFLGWYDNVNEPDPSGRVAAYKAAVDAYGSSADVDEALSPLAFMSMLTTLKFVEQAGGATATPAAIGAAASAYTGGIYMGPPKEDWTTTKVPGVSPGVGVLACRLDTYKGNGKWADSAGGWIYPTGVIPDGS